MSDETDVEDASERLLLKAAKLRSDYDALLSEAADLRERLEIADGQRESAVVRARLADEDTDAVRTALAASEAEVTRLREELAQAKLDIAEGRELIASYDRDTRKLREELAAARRESDEAAQSWVDLTAQVTVARRQLEEARGLMRERLVGERCVRWHVGADRFGCYCIANPCWFCRVSPTLAPAPAPTCATCGGSGEIGYARRGPCPRCATQRNPVKPCETCGVTGGEGFLITNEDGTPCLDRPCPACSRSVKP